MQQAVQKENAIMLQSLVLVKVGAPVGSLQRYNMRNEGETKECFVKVVTVHLDEWRCPFSQEEAQFVTEGERNGQENHFARVHGGPGRQTGAHTSLRRL